MSRDGGIDNGKRKHMLLTVLGTNPREARYSLGDREVTARVAPLALVDLLPDREQPDSILAICTAEAKEESWPLVENALSGRYELQVLDVPGGHSQDDIHTFLDLVARAMPEEDGIDLTVDLTHGFRHFAFLTYTAVLYLSALRRVQMRGAYYGMLQQGAASPFLDLGPLLSLVQWFHALQVLRETGSAAGIAELLQAHPGHASGSVSAQITRHLSEFSTAYLSALPLELGQAAEQFLCQDTKSLSKLLTRQHRLPLADELTRSLTEHIRRFRLRSPSMTEGGKAPKSDVLLSRDELRRQAIVIDSLLAYGNMVAAIGLMSEWMISWAILRQEKDRGSWLDYRSTRQRATRDLHTLSAIRSDHPDLEPLLSDEQRRFAEFWNDLSRLRNAYHHHGMRPGRVVGDEEFEFALERVRSYWDSFRDGSHGFPLHLAGAEREIILITPLGHRPGVLYSALRVAQDASQGSLHRCLVICSRDSATKIREAVDKASFTGDMQTLELEDAFSGFAEKATKEAQARRTLAQAGMVLVNVTGGTTFMGLLAQDLGTCAQRLGRPVRRFGLIDERTGEQQMAEPYVEGRPFWIDREGADGTHN